MPFLNLLINKDIDWDGDCVFENGAVAKFKTEKTSNHWRMRPIPQGLKARNEALEAKERLEKIMRPATKDQISICLKKLSLHCGMQNKAPNEVSAMVADYLYDLAKYPVILLEEACATYRAAPEGNQFMPRSGQLVTLMKDKYHKMKFLQMRIDKILGLYVEPAQKQNKALSLNEILDRLSA